MVFINNAKIFSSSEANIDLKLGKSNRYISPGSDVMVYCHCLTTGHTQPQISKDAQLIFLTKPNVRHPLDVFNSNC